MSQEVVQVPREIIATLGLLLIGSGGIIISVVERLSIERVCDDPAARHP